MVCQEFNYFLEMINYFGKGDYDVKGNFITWVLLTIQFWSIFVEHVIVIIVLTYIYCQRLYKSYY